MYILEEGGEEEIETFNTIKEYIDVFYTNYKGETYE